MLCRLRASVPRWLLTGLLAGGCAAPRPAADRDPLGVVPEDFSLELEILSGRDVQRPAGASFRPARFLLFADGSLYFWSRDQSRFRMPPPRRTLSRRQMAEVWSLVQQIGLGDPARAMPAVELDDVKPEPGQVVYVAVFTGRDERWGYVRRLEPDEPPDPAMSRFAGHLAELAWAGEEGESRVIPRRYDFGPDPYARYRR